MDKILPPESEIIVNPSAALVASLEDGREKGCNLAVVNEYAAKYARSAQTLLSRTAGEPDPAKSTRLDKDYAEAEAAYREWKTVSRAFEETLDQAYNNAGPRKNLLLDQVFSELNESVGFPMSETYTRLRNSWHRHIVDRPWDAFKYDAPEHVDAKPLDDALNALVRGDELDIEDALNDLTGPLRHVFSDFIESHPGDFEDLEVGIWKRPEIVVAHDFWGVRKQKRLLGVLKKNGSRRFAEAFKTLESFYAVQPSPQKIVNALKEIPSDHRAPYYRCLMLHPDYEMRRYAVNNGDLLSLWKVLTPHAVPCATILSLLEKLVGSNHYTNTQRKVFFDTIYRRLLTVTTRSDVLYARGIVRILTKLNFFMEDEYFARLMSLLDYLGQKERIYKIDDVTMREYVDALRREKELVGNVETRRPNFEGIPLVILRKLARDGHFWDLLSMHAIVKIANETVKHINTPDRAFKVVSNHHVNQEVLRSIGKRRSLFSGLNAKLALLSNPRTPLGISLEYLPDLGRTEVETLLRRSGCHPELRNLLRNQYNRSKA